MDPSVLKKIMRLAGCVFAVIGLFFISLFFFRGGGNGKLTWESSFVRKSLMTFAYKIYANPAAQNGRYFLSKIVFHNEGDDAVRDFSVSYQIPDYMAWTTPEAHAEIPAGQTLVQLFYPQLPSKVTALTTQTTVTLETKIRWSEKKGEIKEEVLRSNVELRGVNEIEYTDLPQNEITTWYDVFATSCFAVAMVTPNDPVVKEFAAEVTKRTGGTTGTLGGGQEVARLMQGVYDYMCDTGMRYTTDEGVPSTMGDVRTMVQTVRLPRDVIITNEGLCVELAILWASVMEHMGCRTTLLFRPGHAFTLVYYGDGPTDFIPIECTAITPMAVGEKKPVPFLDAVKMASADLQKQKYQIWLNVKDYQKQGFRAPELPGIEIDKIKGVLAARSNHTPGSYADQVQQTALARPAQTRTGDGPRAGYFHYVAPDNLMSIDIPEHWSRMENSNVPGMVFVAQDMQTTTGVNVFVYHDLRTAADAMRAVSQGISRGGHGRVKVQSQTRAKDNSGTVVVGTTTAHNRTTQWVGILREMPNGVVGFFTGTARDRYQQNQPVMSDVIGSVRFAGGQ